MTSPGKLETQRQGILGPAGQLESLQGTPILLGAFGEASELSQAHQAAAQEMQELLSQVKQAIGFAAENVTKVVASGYEQADQSAASGMGGGSGSGGTSGHSHHSGNADYSANPVAQAVGGVVNGLDGAANGAVGDVTNGVTQVVNGLFNSGGTPA